MRIDSWLEAAYEERYELPDDDTDYEPDFDDRGPDE